MNTGLRILYAEDSPHDADLTRSHFAGFAPHMELVIATTGQECLDLLEADTFDVLLLDYRLPDMEGLQVLKTLAERGARTPVVMVTGMGDEALVVKALRLGAYDYVPKQAGYLETLPAILRAVHVESRLKGSQGLPYVVAPRRILYVEHVPTDIDLTLKHFAEHAPYLLVDVVNSCTEALTRLGQPHRYDLVMSDLRMPDMNGLEFVREAKHRLVSFPPFLLVTGKGDDSTAIAALKLGASDYVVKNPGYLEHLVSTIEQSIVRQWLRQANEHLRLELAEHRRADAKLAETRQRMQLAVRAANVGLWDWDLLSNKVHYSPEWKRQLGYADDEITDDIQEWEARLHPDDKESALRNARMFLMGTTPTLHNEFRLRCKDGSYRKILAQGSINRDATGRPTRMLGSHLDVTEHWELQQILFQARKMEAIGRLSGGVAHDFNNKLSVILGYTDIALERVAHDSVVRDSLIEVRNAAESSADLVRQLLAFSRQQPISPVVLGLDNVLRDSLKMLRLLIPGNIEIHYQPREGPWTVSADPTQIDQLISNLVTNARDAISGRGVVTIDIQNSVVTAEQAMTSADAREGEFVVLSVSDNGCGMNAQTINHIFEPFYTTKETDKGTGLGLATVYGIMRQNNGFIDVRSEVGVGTTFFLYFPRASGNTVHVLKKFESQEVGGTETILLVEDEASLLQLTAALLEGLGYTVLSSITPLDALRQVRDYTRPIDLVITDVVMPGMNGRDLVAQVEQLRPGVRSIYVSGYRENIVAEQGILREDVYFIEKPFTVQTLARKIREVLSGPDERIPPRES